MSKVHVVRIRIAASLLLLLAAATGLGWAQSSSPQNDQDQSVETLKVNVNVVQLFFNVKDKHGLLIADQTKDDFEILEDGKPQTIKYFTAESNLPLTLGILIDSSGSQERVLEMEKEVRSEERRVGKECRARGSEAR